MRLVTVVLLSIAALGLGVSASKPVSTPFEAAWLSCDTNAGYRVCGYAKTTQRGKRVCGIEGYWASGRFYHTRFVGTAAGTSMQIDKICGRPGSETDTNCAGPYTRFLDPKDKVGWGTSRNKFYVCKGRLHSGPADEAFDCATAVRDAGMPKVRRLPTPKEDGPAQEERDWLASCTAGRE
jgi:hypothetical protein